MKPQVFKFEEYKYNPARGVLVFKYFFVAQKNKKIRFQEKLILPRPVPKLDSARSVALDKALFNLFLIAGISYYKTYAPKKILLNNNYKLNREQARFWNKLYTKGLGEFFYKNKIDFRGLVKFPYDRNYKEKAVKIKTRPRSLATLGGGKDSIVALELLAKNKMDFDLYSLRDFKVTRQVAQKTHRKLLMIDRQIDPKLFRLNQQPGVYNGHIPFSAYLAFTTILAGILYDYKYIVLPNEYSSNYANVKYLGLEVNHQYSKSFEFEKDFNNYVTSFITPNVKYFSLLRPWYEIKIVREFAKYRKYFKAFSSCNKNFRFIKKMKRRWCGECPKCAFIWAMLSAFISKKELIEIFGKNLYADKKLVSTFWQLLGKKDFKPFECVGLPEEVVVAMYLAHQKGEFENDLIMKRFVKEVLPKQKDIKQLENRLFTDQKPHNLPDGFVNLLKPEILILGFAREGLSTLKFLLRKNFMTRQISIADQKIFNKFEPVYKKALNKFSKENLLLGKNYLKNLDKFDLIIKTSGLKLDDKLVKKLGNQGVEITTNLNIFLNNIKGKVIGVTGTKGKSTTASLIYQILKTAEKKVVLVGNIGKPFLDYLNQDSKSTIFVAELSSYQLDNLKGQIDIGVITSFFPEHLDYHGSLKKYFEAKMNLVKNSKIIIFRGNQKPVPSEQMLMSESRGPVKKSMNYETELIGKHNIQNINNAIKVAKLFKIKPVIIKKALKNFKPLEHRLEFVGKFKGINFYNDVLSTTPESTIEAIESLKNLETIIIGGYDRGLDYKKLARKIVQAKIQNVIYWPHAGVKVAQRLKKSKLNLVAVKNMRQSVNKAFKLTSKNSIVLLSPAASSYDYYKDYREKGEEFKKMIKYK